MYVCGPTVYDSPHLGHAKSAVIFDLVHRYLKFKGYEVKIVKNYTDIDDKIIARANELGADYQELSKKYIKEYQEIMEILNVQKETQNPRATEFIDYIIKFIEELIAKGNAYEKNGSVYFSVKTFPKYDTILQNIKNEEIQDEEDDYLGDQDTAFGKDKNDPRDFALWKKSKRKEPFWESPWGKGRPGWHIECSSMVLNLLGKTIDIHAGGQDLKFPHHRNEIAQSESFTGKPFARFFMHNGFVNIDDEKMSKSLGNFFLVSEVIEKYDPMVVRWFLLTSHYRSSMNYSLDTMNQAERTYKRMLNTIKKVNETKTFKEDSKEVVDLIERVNQTESKILDALDDDFDTPVAIAELLMLFKDVNKAVIEDKVKITIEFKDRFVAFIGTIETILGIFPKLEGSLSLFGVDEVDEKDRIIRNLIDLILDTRSELRKRKMYSISDKIRDRLNELGIQIEDTGS